jgi:hypothetical protein
MRWLATKRSGDGYLMNRPYKTTLSIRQNAGTRGLSMQKTKIAAEELAEMIRDGLAEEGHDVQVHPNPETGWDVAVVSANEAEDAGSRAEAIAAGLRQRYDLET